MPRHLAVAPFRPYDLLRLGLKAPKPERLEAFRDGWTWWSDFHIINQGLCAPTAIPNLLILFIIFRPESKPLVLFIYAVLAALVVSMENQWYDNGFETGYPAGFQTEGADGAAMMAYGLCFYVAISAVSEFIVCPSFLRAKSIRTLRVVPYSERASAKSKGPIND